MIGLVPVCECVRASALWGCSAWNRRACIGEGLLCVTDPLSPVVAMDAETQTQAASRGAQHYPGAWRRVGVMRGSAAVPQVEAVKSRPAWGGRTCSLPRAPLPRRHLRAPPLLQPRPHQMATAATFQALAVRALIRDAPSRVRGSCGVDLPFPPPPSRPPPPDC